MANQAKISVRKTSNISQIVVIGLATILVENYTPFWIQFQNSRKLVWYTVNIAA